MIEFIEKNKDIRTYRQITIPIRVTSQRCTATALKRGPDHFLKAWNQQGVKIIRRMEIQILFGIVSGI